MKMPLKITSLRYTVCLVLLLGFASCGVKKTATTSPAIGVNSSMGAKTVIKNHYKAAGAFKTLSGSMKIDYQSGKTSQGIPATFRMERDKALWISVFFGMGKAYITPKKVAFYSSVNKVSFEGDFETLSAYIGTPLTFNTIQGLLLGESALDLKAQKFKVAPQSNAYRLKPQRALAFFKIFVDIDPSHFKVKQTQISQAKTQGNLHISYPSYTQIDGILLPASIDIQAQMGEIETSVGIKYKNISVNRPLRFPFKIPKGLNALSLPEHAK